MSFEIKFKTNSDAFREDMSSEVIRILYRIMSEIDCGTTENRILDLNGNSIGRWRLGLKDSAK
jgi:hypothetical protein